MELDDLMLTREQILALDDLKREEVKVPEWGGTVFVAMMSGAARDEWELSLLNDKGKANLTDARAKLAAACVVDEKGKRLFSTGDIAALSQRSSVALDRIVNAARRLNRLGEREFEEALGN
jgi:hypothetical protein